MAKAKGYQAIVGVKKATTWGTAVACGAADGLEVLTVGLTANREIVPDMSITGRVTHRQGDQGNVAVTGSLTLPMRYEGLGRLLAGVMGTAGAPTTVDVTGKKHVFKINDTIDGIFWTMAYEILKDTTVFEFNTVKITGFTIKATIPGRIEVEVRGIGHAFSDASIVNTTTTIDTVTVPANAEIAQSRQMVVRMNAQTGAGLASTDAVFLTALEIAVDRPMEADYTTEFGDRSSEPMPPSGGDPFLKVTGTLTFSQYQTGTPGQNAAFVMEQYNRTLKKMDVVLTGDNLAGSATQKFGYSLYLPMVVLGEGKPTLAAGALAWSLPFEAHHVTVVPTGWPAGYLDAVVIENYNQLTTDVLA